MTSRILNQEPCVVPEILGLLAGKWKTEILYYLFAREYLRFGQLRRLLPGISQRVLTRTLRELERDGFVRRAEKQGSIPHVEYSLTPLGHALRPLFDYLEQWGEHHLPRVEQARSQHRAGAALAL